MANMVSNNHSTASSSGSGYGSHLISAVVGASPIASSAAACPYDKIIEMIKGLDLQDDGIMMNHKIKSIEVDFCNIVRDENMLNESMDYINNKVLSDGDTSLKFALLFSSRNFDSLAMNETKVRSKMLKILETNFENRDIYRMDNKNRLYNSITLLGEYYHRVRLADNKPITILGESLIGMLMREISDNNVIDVKLAKLILSQVTLNGDIMRIHHKDELTQLLYHIRRNLIEQSVLQPAVKALLLMTLDLYYSNFSNLGSQLEEMYTKYLVEESNNNDGVVEKTEEQSSSVDLLQHHHESESAENYDNGSSANDSFGGEEGGCTPVTKKWSEQVCEDSFYENEVYCAALSDANATSPPQRQNNSYKETATVGQMPQSQNSNDDQHLNATSTSYRSYREDDCGKRNFNSDSYQQREEQDISKPLPRWRAPRFNRGGSEQDDRPFANTNQGNRHHNNRRFSASFDDDRNSVRSDGGSIRLYSINDRLKHSQEKMDRGSHHGGGSGYYGNNSNWDRQNNHGGGYQGNFDRNNRRGRGNYRQTYDRPPRFMKKNNPPQSSSDAGGDHQQWRAPSTAAMTSSYHEEKSYSHNDPANDADSRSSLRAQTLPRPPKGNFNGNGRHSQSPPSHNNSYDKGFNSNNPRNHHHHHNNNNNNNQQRRPQHSRNFSRNNRYSSQSSLASEASSTLDRRHHRSNYTRNGPNYNHNNETNNWEDTHSVHGQPEEASWNSKDNNSELVRNARNTTKFMNYLSQK